MLLKQFVAGLLRLSILTVVFLGSCVGSGLMYMQSPKWDLEEVDLDKERTFMSAYLAHESDQVTVEFYQYLPDPSESEKISYRMPREKISHKWEGGGSATITAEDQADGSQLVQIFAVGDTPWTSLSEYRVRDNEIYPLRHGSSNHWFLLGALLSPFITWLLQKPVRRLVGLLVGVEQENSKSGSI